MNQIQEKKSTFNIAEIVYILYFSVMTLAKGLGLYDGMWPYTLSLYIGAFLIFVKLALSEYTLAEWLYVLSMLAMGGFILHNSDQTGALIYISMIVAMKNISVKRLFTIGVSIWTTTFIFQILLSITGINPGIFVVHEKLGLGYMIRWALGQPHPNVLQITSLMICAMILYLANLKGRKLVYATAIIFVANLYIFFYSVSYTGLILVVFYLAANLYLSFKKELCKFEKMLVNLIFPICAAFSILGPLFFPEKLWNLCNKVLNTRFNLARIHMTTDSITLFGARPSDAIPQRLHNLDSSYVFVLMRYGIVLFVLMCVAYMAYIYHCTNQKKYKELAITIGLCVAAIAEPFFVNPSFKNISLLFVGEFIFVQFDKFAQRKPDLFLNKKFCLCSLGAKEITLPIDFFADILTSYRNCVKKNISKLVVVALCFGILTGTTFAFTADIPSRYYALRSSTQFKTNEYLLLDLENLPDDFEGKILNYMDAETPMLMFEGNISKVEYARGIVSSGLWCGLFVAFAFSVVLTCQQFFKNKPKLP